LPFRFSSYASREKVMTRLVNLRQLSQGPLNVKMTTLSALKGP
jgi:hypothetical protein